MHLIVRRMKPNPSYQWAFLNTHSYDGFITAWEGDTLELEADHRRHAQVGSAIGIGGNCSDNRYTCQ